MTESAPISPKMPQRTNRAKGAPRDRVAKREGPELAQTIAMMAANRIPLLKIGRAVQRDWKTVRAILGRAETQRMMEDYRTFMRSHALAQSIDIQTQGFDWVRETMAAKDPKAFALVSKGMGDLERIYASAAGEGQKTVQVAQVNVSGDSPTAEIKALLASLLPPTP